MQVYPNKMSKQISVIIPVYNVEQYLRQCLDSIGVLGRVDVEVILVNDGSTDGSRVICEEYVTKWDNVFLINKENGGLSDARNKGTEVATGEYICYVDSDDWLAPDAIDLLYQFAVENKCEIVQGSFYYAFSDHLEHNDRYFKADDDPFVLTREEAIRELVRNLYVKNFAWGRVYKTSLAKAHPFPFGKYFEDSYWQHLMIHDCSRYGVLPAPLYYYRQRPNSISNNLGMRYLDLNQGLESRLLFVKEHYPELTSLAADELWKSSFEMRDRGKEMKQLFRSVRDKYASLFSDKLKQTTKFKLANRDSVLLPFYLFYERVDKYIHRRPLGRIQMPS